MSETALRAANLAVSWEGETMNAYRRKRRGFKSLVIPSGGLLAAVFAAPAVKAMPITGNFNFRTMSVYPTALIGPVQPDPGIGSDTAYLGKIFGQIGISATDLSDTTLRADSGGADAGSWTSAQVSGTLLGNNNAANNALNIYYVPKYPSSFGQAWSAEDVPGSAVAIGTVLGQGLGTGRRVDSSAHEIGHVLVDTWRWKSTEQAAASGIHSNNANDVMADGGIRNIPASLAQAAPQGNFDKIGNNVGPTSASATAIVPLIQAMYSKNTFVTNIQRSQTTVTVGQYNSPTNLTSSGSFGWGLTQTLNDAANTGKSWAVNEVAQKVANGQEIYTFFYDAASAFGAGGQALRVTAGPISSLDSPITGLIGAPIVTAYSNILTDAGKATLVQGVGNDYTWGSGFNSGTGTINMTVDISNALALSNDKDIVVQFTVQAPEPASLSVLILGAAGLLARRHRKRPPMAIG
jgi:hypothetical protein